MKGLSLQLFMGSQHFLMAPPVVPSQNAWFVIVRSYFTWFVAFRNTRRWGRNRMLNLKGHSACHIPPPRGKDHNVMFSHGEVPTLSSSVRDGHQTTLVLHLTRTMCSIHVFLCQEVDMTSDSLSATKSDAAKLVKGRWAFDMEKLQITI